jgi:hypothetical protein
MKSRPNKNLKKKIFFFNVPFRKCMHALSFAGGIYKGRAREKKLCCSISYVKGKLSKRKGAQQAKWSVQTIYFKYVCFEAVSSV